MAKCKKGSTHRGVILQTRIKLPLQQTILTAPQINDFASLSYTLNEVEKKTNNVFLRIPYYERYWMQTC